MTRGPRAKLRREEPPNKRLELTSPAWQAGAALAAQPHR